MSAAADSRLPEVNDGTVEELETFASDGRRVALWRDRAASTLPPIVVASGFGRTMASSAPLAGALQRNGFTVYRFDSLDHDGLSDGRIEDFVMSSALRSMEAAVETALSLESASTVGIAAASLSARAAYRLASRDERVAFLVSAVGVVNLRATLRHVLGGDFVDLKADDLPPWFEFERRRVRSQPFWTDGHELGWFGLDETIQELARAPQPIANVMAQDDAWVKEEDVRVAFGVGDGERHLAQMSHAGHDFGQSLTVARHFLRYTTASAVRLATGTDAAVKELPFDDLVHRTAVERRLHRRRRSERADADATKRSKVS